MIQYINDKWCHNHHTNHLRSGWTKLLPFTSNSGSWDHWEVTTGSAILGESNLLDLEPHVGSPEDDTKNRVSWRGPSSEDLFRDGKWWKMMANDGKWWKMLENDGKCWKMDGKWKWINMMNEWVSFSGKWMELKLIELDGHMMELARDSPCLLKNPRNVRWRVCFWPFNHLLLSVACKAWSMALLST